MAEQVVQQDAQPVFISFKLEGDDAVRFNNFKRRMNIRGNSEIVRKALFDQIDESEREETKVA